MDVTPAETPPEPLPPACAACGQPLAGRFRFACGERLLESHEQTIRHFIVHALVPELVSLDGKIWRTLRLLLFRPGYLTLEYVAGRRGRYVKPLRVLLTAIIVYALATLSGRGFT